MIRQQSMELFQKICAEGPWKFMDFGVDKTKTPKVYFWKINAEVPNLNADISAPIVEIKTYYVIFSRIFCWRSSLTFKNKKIL